MKKEIIVSNIIIRKILERFRDEETSTAADQDNPSNGSSTVSPHRFRPQYHVLSTTSYSQVHSGFIKY